MCQLDAECPSAFLCSRRIVRMSQQGAAAFVGVSRQKLGAIEAGKSPPKTRDLLALASLYRRRPEALAGNVCPWGEGEVRRG